MRVGSWPMFTVKEIPSQLKIRRRILALGSDTRQRISWADKGRIYSLAPQEDLSSIEDFYFKASAFLSKKIKLRPDLITFDPHPLFASSRLSVPLRQRFFKEAKLLPVFHHVAHAANFGIEAGTHRNFIAVAFDGTGFGADGNVWGGEFFVYAKGCFQRKAHFEYQPLAGGEAAIREPWRVAFAVLYGIYGRKILRMRPGFLKGVAEEKLDLVAQMVEKRFNAPLTSSAGRLFDAVSVLLALKTTVQKEAEAAVALERTAAGFKGNAPAYGFSVRETAGLSVIGLTPMFREMMKDIAKKRPVPEIAYRFHMTLACVIACVCSRLGKKYKTRNVYLCGGVFMNDILTRESGELLVKAGLRPYFAKRPATTDLGISQGQVAACEMGNLSRLRLRRDVTECP